MPDQTPLPTSAQLAPIHLQAWPATSDELLERLRAARKPSFALVEFTPHLTIRGVRVTGFGICSAKGKTLLVHALGMTEKEAQARVAMLNLPGRPSGFYSLS